MQEEQAILSIEDFINVLVELTRQGFPTTEFQDGLVKTQLAAEEATQELNNLYEATKSVSDAQEEYADNGYVSAETAYELISANDELASSLIATENGFIFNADAAIQTLQAQVALQLEELNLGNIAEYVRQGMYNQAAAMLAAGSGCSRNSCRYSTSYKHPFSISTTIWSNIGIGWWRWRRGRRKKRRPKNQGNRRTYRRPRR